MKEGHKPVLVVTGAAGQMGRRVVELLLETQAGRIVATTRNPKKIADLADRGAIVRHADFDEPRSLINAFDGAERLLLISTDAVDLPGRRVKQHKEAIEAAKRAGVQHIVYTSVTNPEPPTPVLVAQDHWDTEQLVAASGLSWTVLRNNVYSEVILIALPDAVVRGQLPAAAGEDGAAWVTREDCARVAAAILASSETSNRAIDVTGPAVVNYHEIARLATELTGHPVSYLPLEPEAFRANVVANGLPEFVADLFLSFHLGMAQGKFAPATSAVEELTGRRPTSVAEFLATHRNVLVSRA